MKKFFVLAFFATLLISCSNKETKNAVPAEDISENNVANQIGVQHNQCLAQIYTILNHAPKTKSGAIALSKAEVTDSIKRTTIKFVEKNYQLKPEEMAVVEETINLQLALKDTLLIRAIDNMTTTQISFFEEIDLIMSDEDTNIQSLKNRLTIIKNRALESLEGVEANQIISAISVAENTLDYWFDNNTSWQHTINGSSCEDGRFDWKSLGKADVRGCVTAAASGGAAWLLGCGPVGWKAWAAVCLSGAVMRSADNAIEQLW